MMSQQTALSFKAPGPGAWSLETGHFARPLTRFYGEAFSSCFREGFRQGTARYGALLDYIEVTFVNQVAYVAFRPVGAPRSATKPPPAMVFKILTRVHPEMRRRLQTSERVFTDKIWRAELEQWDREVKPTTIRGHRALQAVDVHGLEGPALLDYFERCRKWGQQMIVQHHRYNIPALLSVGDLLAHARQWANISSSQILPLLRGVSPASRGRTPEMGALVEALRQSPQSLAKVQGTDAATEVLAALQRTAGSVGDATRAYLDMVGYCLVGGYDLADCYALELPEVLLANIRDAINSAPGREDSALQSETARVRDAIPDVHRPLFDALLAEAKHMYRLRDERSLYSDLWAYGLLRRLVLAQGQRLAQRGLLAEAFHLVEATSAEMRSLMTEGKGPSAEELAARYQYRTTLDLNGLTKELGKMPGEPPPVEWLPPAAGRVFAAVNAAMDLVFGELDAPREAFRLQGISASAGEYEGRARLVVNPDDLIRVRQGDVLVTRATSSGFNIVLPLLGAIVTERGGQLCHAAIVAREYGIPAIVGLKAATQHIPDGARVHVNGSTGEARIVA